MTSASEQPEEAHRADTRVASSSGPDKAGLAGDGKGREIILGEEAPGWTIMRPLSKKGKKMAGSSTRRASSAHAGSSGDEADYDLHENLEALREVTSEDELLEDGEEEERATRSRGEAPRSSSSAQRTHDADASIESSAPRRRNVGEYKVYKRRWFGVVQLVLLNTVVSWDWLSFSANSTTVSQYYGVSESSVNWLSTAFLFAFVVVSPVVVYTLHRGGPKPSIVTASVLILVGNWIRYGATRSGPQGNFGGVMFGQLLTGFAQPFVLSAPTRYSDLWFTNTGRVAATAVMSLANPFGGALAQLIDPFWAGSPGDIPSMVLYVAVISSVASIPSFFIPSAPPTPCSPSSAMPKQQLLPSLRSLFTSPEFYMVMVPYTIYVGLFNSISSLINQMLAPYSFSETQAGIAGGLLIVVGLVTAAITSPIIDRTKTYLLAIKIQVPILAACYLAFTWAPGTRSIGAVYAILSIMGAASFSLVPVVLEYLIEITHPVSPEVSSTICWTGGQFTGALFILISDALRAAGAGDGSADDGSKFPPGNMYRALVFQTVLALVVVPLPLALGCCGRGKGVRMRRLEADNEARRASGEVEGAGALHI